MDTIKTNVLRNEKLHFMREFYTDMNLYNCNIDSHL